MAIGGSTSKTRPGDGTPDGEQMADQIAFIQINQETRVVFRNHFKQIIAVADSLLDAGAFNLRNCGIRIHLVPKYPSVIRRAGDRCFLSHLLAVQA